jgi:hypothetical protein
VTRDSARATVTTIGYMGPFEPPLVDGRSVYKGVSLVQYDMSLHRIVAVL